MEFLDKVKSIEKLMNELEEYLDDNQSESGLNKSWIEWEQVGFLLSYDEAEFINNTLKTVFTKEIVRDEKLNQLGI